MATTTNYSWSTPDDTALVKDGAAAIRSLGTAIDTTVFTNAGAAVQKSVVDAAGDLLVGTANDTVGRLAIGTANQQLRVNSGATSLEYFTPSASGGTTLISETVASSNSSINLTSIPGTYKQLLLVWSGLYPSGAGSVFSIRFNNDSTASIYEGMLTPISSPARFSSDAADDGTNGGLFGYNSVSNSSTYQQQVMGVLLIDNYASTSKYKFYNGNASWVQGTTNYVPKVNGVYKSTSAITSLDIVRLSGSDTLSNATSTSIRLYGLS